jgi:hypothetical protein
MGARAPVARDVVGTPPGASIVAAASADGTGIGALRIFRLNLRKRKWQTYQAAWGQFQVLAAESSIKRNAWHGLE